MRLDEHGLLAALHEGVFEQPLWHGFLERLRVRSGAPYVSLILRNVNDETVTELYAGPAAPLHLDRLFTEKYGRDPLPYAQMREGRIYALEELIDPNDPVLRSYQRDFLNELGIKAIRSLRVKDDGGVDAWLSIAGDRDIGPATGALLTALFPHLRIALRTFIAMERDRFRATVTSEAFRRLNFGWITLDARCRIIDMTPDVEQLFQRSSILRRGRYDQLTPASPAIDRELSALVKAFAQDAEARPKAINLSRDPLIDMLVRPIQERSLSAPSAPVAIAFISGDRLSQADRCDQLVDLFGLLPSEARLAWAIAQGMPIAEAAGELGLTVETARNYSKKIYAKTGARGQAELVRNVMTSVLALA